MNEMKVARGLGWFSLGLGLAEVLIPARITRTLGTRNRTTLVRTAYGLREIAAGVGLLTTDSPGPWLWGRVAGDMLDLATLGAAQLSSNTNRVNVTLATAAVLGVTAIDVACARRFTA